MIRFLCFALVITLFHSRANAQLESTKESEVEEGAQSSVPDPERWELTFSDEFEGERLDYGKWMPKDPWGVVRNDELQAYILKAFSIEGGILRITCEAEAAYYDGAKRDYRSGMMTTSGRFSQRYGRFEIRCRVPKGRGLWPAFWMLPEPPAWPPEIDILEILCQEPDKLYMSNHWPNPSDPDGNSLSQTGEFEGVDFSDGFHTVAVEWDPGEIRWYVDGIERHRSRESVPDVPMFLLANLAVGGWAELPTPETRFPAIFEIDYVRAWQEKKRLKNP
ncbi:MAG: glycoside hydrolase family 16 protein [Verrucomicrobiae bacterium]|nr:glycoside hydrolase family 16 protein [Verrucomicrobiae bacterium]